MENSPFTVLFAFYVVNPLFYLHFSSFNFFVVQGFCLQVHHCNSLFVLNMSLWTLCGRSLLSIQGPLLAPYFFYFPRLLSFLHPSSLFCFKLISELPSVEFIFRQLQAISCIVSPVLFFLSRRRSPGRGWSVFFTRGRQLLRSLFLFPPIVCVPSMGHPPPPHVPLSCSTTRSGLRRHVDISRS